MFFCVACNYPGPAIPPPTTETPAAAVTALSSPSAAPPRLLTICMGQEPASLFLYGDASQAARNVRQAIYDGPFDVVDYQLRPVILEKAPSLAGGDASIQAITVPLGTPIVDASGALVNLAEGVAFLPAGCNDAGCAQVYAGRDPVQMDQLVVRFILRPGILWSDGAPLTAGDSVYSYEVARSKGIYPRMDSTLIAHTQSYQALDEKSVEWRGLPGYKDPGYAANFFTPLPRHAWGSLQPEELLTADTSNRTPLGWGPYIIDEWTPGDHISLSRNPNYFRQADGLPAFDKLVFRFIPGREEALAALQAGECDFLDETSGLEAKGSQLLELKNAGKVAAEFVPGTAWEHADFGLAPVDPLAHPPLFQVKETRQAIAMCINRQRMADELFFGQSLVPDTYIPPSHPLANPDVRRYAFDPQTASGLLDAAGWKDADGDPGTPRLSLAVPGLPDGTPLAFKFLTTTEEEKQRAAQILAESLAQCGVKVEISTLPWEQLYAPGPEGPLFGRNFDLAQFGWVSPLEPPCFLYTSQEIPGPAPEYPKGWGGANASGFNHPAFDQACRQALSTLPDAPEHRSAHFQAQTVFAEELPAIPLYERLKLVAMRPDLCGFTLNPSMLSALWNLEVFDYGESCPK